MAFGRFDSPLSCSTRERTVETNPSDPLGGGFDRLADALRGRRAEVLSAWERAVRRSVADADEFTVAQLLDSVPVALDQICIALALRDPDATRLLIEATQAHGTTRFGQRYTAAELLVEYQVLRQVVFEQVHEVVDGSLTTAELMALNWAVDAVVQGGTVAFVTAQRHHLERAAEVESKFLAYLAHDQRNHLNQALLLLELHTAEVGQHPALAASLDDLRQVRQAIHDTAEGMERLMEAERLRRAAAVTRRQAVPLEELLHATATTFAAASAAKGIAVAVDAPASAAVNSDPALIKLAINNLVGNAIKFSERGTVRLAARPWVDAAEGGWQLTVADDGPGIAADKFGRLFDAFARGETHGQGGMGLGLSIASQAARLLGGTLAVESTVGVGSTFTLSIPTGPADLRRAP
jgi:signal transduction histidine kinase